MDAISGPWLMVNTVIDSWNCSNAWPLLLIHAPMMSICSMVSSGRLLSSSIVNCIVASSVTLFGDHSNVSGESIASPGR